METKSPTTKEVKKKKKLKPLKQRVLDAANTTKEVKKKKKLKPLKQRVLDAANTTKEVKKKKKLKPLKQRVLDAAKGTGGARGNRKVNEDGLNAQQEKFCEVYVSKEFFCNGTQSYIEAYNVKVGKGKGFTSYEVCRFRAHQLLTNANILKRIDELLEDMHLNDAYVDKQLGKLISQDAEFRPKLGAIQEYNKLKKRTSEKIEHVHAFTDISNMSDEELAKEEERLRNFFGKK